MPDPDPTPEATPPPNESEPEQEAKAEVNADDAEVTAFIVRAMQYIDEERRLPRPSTWRELLAGMVVWLGRRWADDNKRRPCGNCGSEDWEFGPVVSLDADPRWPVSEERGHGSFPYFQVGCRRCGNTLFINALSVFEPQKPSEPDVPEAP